MATQTTRATTALYSQMDGPMNTTSNKRKRESADAGDTTRSGNNKRPSQGGATTNGNSHEPSHAPGSSFAGIGGHDTQQSAEDMSALNQQLLQEHNLGLQSNGGRSVDATISAAKAASGLASSMGALPVNDMSFASTGSGGEGAPFGPGSQHNYPDPNMDMNPYHTPGSTAAQVQAARDATNMSHHKPPVGSPEWHAQRKSSHKEVERRRRETINEGINELAKIVPNCEKNKGQILQRTVTYIQQLQDNERQSSKNLGYEKMTLEQALREVTVQNDKLKAEIQRSWKEAEKWELRCREAGLPFDDYTNEHHGVGEGVDEVDPAIGS